MLNGCAWKECKPPKLLLENMMINWLNTVFRFYTLWYIVDKSMEHHHFWYVQSRTGPCPFLRRSLHLGLHRDPLGDPPFLLRVRRCDSASSTSNKSATFLVEPLKERHIHTSNLTTCQGFLGPRSIWELRFRLKGQTSSTMLEAYGLKGGDFEFPTKHFFFAGKDFQPLGHLKKTNVGMSENVGLIFPMT